MEYIKKEELIIGEVYTHQNGNICRCDQITNTTICGKYINITNHEFRKPPENPGNFWINEMRLATPEEKHWLNCCITADKFITFEEAMKTFIPEYVECIASVTDSFTENKIYKIENFDNNRNFNILDNDNVLRKIIMIGGLWSFKPSTKEAYDAQFVVKEPEFVLPKKWCLKITKENLDFCKSLENNELKFHKNYTYSIGVYYSPIPNKNCNGFINIPKNYTEITFEQFKKYVLKEETAIEFGNKIDKEIIEPLPQFKVIETIETITKVENNEGNQFFIGDTVKSLNSNQKGTITKFKYSADKSDIIAITTFQQSVGISINKIEHYIKPKVEVKEENLLEKAKRLYPIGTKFKSANSKAILTINNHIQEICTNPLTIIFNTVEANPEGFYYGCVHNGKGEWAKIINNK